MHHFYHFCIFTPVGKTLSLSLRMKKDRATLSTGNLQFIKIARWVQVNRLPISIKVAVGHVLTGDTRKIFVSNICFKCFKYCFQISRPSTSLTLTANSARVLVGCKPTSTNHVQF